MRAYAAVSYTVEHPQQENQITTHPQVEHCIGAMVEDGWKVVSVTTTTSPDGRLLTWHVCYELPRLRR